jgi:hypothetical protein
MAELKTVVGELLKKEEGKGKIACIIDVGTKFPVNISAWMEAYQQPGVPAPIMAQLEAIKPGMKVEATYSETAGKNKVTGAPVTFKNLYGIVLVTDATPVKAPEKARSDGQTPPAPPPAKPADNKGREWETVEEKRNSMVWMNATNNATAMYSPLMLEDYKNAKGLDEVEMDRHIGNIMALASRLHDELDAAIKGQK